MNFDIETIMLVITILGGIASIFDIIEGLANFTKVIVKLIKWIMEKIHNEKK